MLRHLSSVGFRIAAALFLMAGCGSNGSSSGAGASGGQSAAGGAGSGGVTANGGNASGGATGSGGKAGSGGATGTGGTVSDASAPTGDGSVGCGKSGAATGVLSAQTITVGDKSRTYVLSVPKSYTPDAPLPLVFAWHGMGGSGSVARQYFAIESAAANGAIFVYPDGLPVGDGGAGWDLSSTGIDFAFFETLLTYVSDNYCIDRNRVFSTGHSFGALFTNSLGCYRGDVLRAIGPVAGAPPFSYGRSGVTCVGNVAAIVIHGENDPTVDFTTSGIASRDFWIGKNGCSTSVDPVAITPAACVEYQGCQPDLPVVWCVHTEQHNWPTSRNCPDGGICFDAGPAIWSFFTRFK